MTSLFSKIVKREIPAHIVYEDDVCIVILDKFPSIKGQSLVIPKAEVDYAFDLPDDIYHHLFDIAKMVAHALDTTFDTERTCLIVEGFEVPHVHIKLYPVPKGTAALGPLLTQGSEAPDEELAATAAELRTAITRV
ncbi:MAG: HIT family protein [Candidatus Paceibacterota bacterium]